ncbi:MAG: hypothetical protein AB7G93_01750 [Bdellovibrionales bacterium]
MKRLMIAASMIAILITAAAPALAAEPVGVTALKLTPAENPRHQSRAELENVQKDIEQVDEQIKEARQEGLVFRQVFGTNSGLAYTATAQATALEMQRGKLVVRRAELLNELRSSERAGSL